MHRQNRPLPPSSKAPEQEKSATGRFLSPTFRRPSGYEPPKKVNSHFNLTTPKPHYVKNCMIKKLLLTTALLGACFCFTLSAEDTNAAAATATNAVAVTTNAPPAETTPKPDAAGTVTGAASDAADAGGNTFVLTE